MHVIVVLLHFLDFNCNSMSVIYLIVRKIETEIGWLENVILAMVIAMIRALITF